MEPKQQSLETFSGELRERIQKGVHRKICVYKVCVICICGREQTVRIDPP
jgi:hypothetical protein